MHGIPTQNLLRTRSGKTISSDFAGGAMFYGTFWCPACDAQRQLFGMPAWQSEPRTRLGGGLWSSTYLNGGQNGGYMCLDFS